MKTNYHTHHYLCQHAGGDCKDYVEEALQQGFTELGFSDHAPYDEKHLGYRMLDPDFQVYLDDISHVQTVYKDRLTIKAGIEIEHWYTNPEYYDRFIPHLDYMILGQHFISMNKDDQNLISSFGLSTKEQILIYAETLCDAMQTKRFKIIAHPELYMHGYKDFDDYASQAAHMICNCAKETDTILEFNANGFNRDKIHTPQGYVHPYPRSEFWKIAEQYQVRTILSSDCHSPSQLYNDTIQKAEEVFEKINLPKVRRFEQF